MQLTVAHALSSPLTPPPPNTHHHTAGQVRLAVAGAFHTQYMAPAAERLQQALAATTIVAPRIPVISNVDAAPHSDPETIKAILVQQVCMCAGVQE